MTYYMLHAPTAMAAAFPALTAAQFDIHSPQTTVAEAVYFSARLRLPSSVPNDQATIFQEEVCHVCCRGIDGSSMEQPKRLTTALGKSHRGT